MKIKFGAIYPKRGEAEAWPYTFQARTLASKEEDEDLRRTVDGANYAFQWASFCVLAFPINYCSQILLPLMLIALHRAIFLIH